MNALQAGPILQSLEREISLHAVLMFRQRRHLRRWAAHVLLVWLFGLGMGVANACALGEAARHADGVDAIAKVALSHHQGDANGDGGRSNCLDLCAKSSVGVPNLKVADDSPAAGGFAVLVPGQMGAIKPAEFGTHRLVVDALPPRGSPPLRIAYQRLAL